VYFLYTTTAICQTVTIDNGLTSTFTGNQTRFDKLIIGTNSYGNYTFNEISNNFRITDLIMSNGNANSTSVLNLNNTGKSLNIDHFNYKTIYGSVDINVTNGSILNIDDIAYLPTSNPLPNFNLNVDNSRVIVNDTYQVYNSSVLNINNNSYFQTTKITLDHGYNFNVNDSSVSVAGEIIATGRENNIDNTEWNNSIIKSGSLLFTSNRANINNSNVNINNLIELDSIELLQVHNASNVNTNILNSKFSSIAI